MLTGVAGLKPGFANPVMEAQAAFRAVLHALSYPGHVLEAGAGLDPPSPLHPAAAAAGLTLFDLDTPLWLDGATDTPEVKAFFAFHNGCPLVDDPGEARFAVIGDARVMPSLDRFEAGSDDAPDRSATLIIQVARFLQDPGGVTLTGPGIRDEQCILLDGLPTEFWHARRALQRRYPCGIDVIFTAGQRVVGLPRTTLVEL